MPQDKSTPRATHSRCPVSRSQFRTILFALALVVSLPAMSLAGGLDSGTAEASSSAADISPSLATTSTTSSSLTTQTATTDNASYDDDFEDGDYENWTQDANNLTISTESFWGSNSLEVSDGVGSSPSEARARWSGGPTFDTGDNFEITGTVWNGFGSTTDGQYTRMGIEETSGDDVLFLVFSKEHGTTHLSTSFNSNTGDDAINSHFSETWVEYRLQLDGGTARAKVWEAGTSEPDSWQLTEDFNKFQGNFFLSPGADDRGRTMRLDEIDAGGNAISGQVIDQNGEPASYATIEGMGVNSDAINDSVEDKQAKAEELLAEAQEVGSPDSWDSQFDIEGHYQDADSTYLLAHEASEWETQTQLIVDDPQLGRPKLQFDPGEEVVLSMWDPTASSGIFSNQIDGSFPGKTSEGEIVIEQYSATGEVIDDETYETETIAESSGTNIVGTSEYPGVKTSFSTGFYKVYPEGNEAAGYTIMVGDAEDQYDRLESNLKNEAGQLTETAQQLRENVESGLFERRTTTADENGKFTLRMQNGVQRAAIQAYRADGTVLTDITGPSFSDLRDASESGTYNGTFHIGAPERHDVPADNVTVQTYRTDTLPMQGIESYADLQQFLRNQQLNESIEEIQSEYDRKFSEMNRSRLKSTYKTHRPLVETVPRAEDRYLERSEFDSIQDAGDLSNDELATETGHMQTALTGVNRLEPPEPDDNAITIEDSELRAERLIPRGIEDDTIQPELHWSNGTSEQVSDEYWSVESDITGQRTLVVDGYPINESDPPAFDLRIIGGGEDGMLDDRLSALNPSFGGSVPDIGAIDVSTMAPGNSERVSMTFRPSDDSNFGAVESVDVIGPEGQTVETSISGDDKASFETDGTGEHFVRATISDTTGGQFVHTFSLDALEQGRSDPPTVRAETATGDRIFAVVGEGLEDGRVQRTDNGLNVDAVVPGGEIPGSVHVKPQAAIEDGKTELNIRVLEGSDEATVSSNIETVVHIDSLSEDARVWRGEPGWFGQALQRDGGTRYGEVLDRGGEDSDKVVIRTYSTADGSVDLTIDSRGGFSGTYDGYRHGFAATVPKPSLPFGLGMVAPAAGGGTVAGVFGLAVARRRRRGAS